MKVNKNWVKKVVGWRVNNKNNQIQIEFIDKDGNTIKSVDLGTIILAYLAVVESFFKR